MLESHIKMGGSAHSFTHGHDGGKYSFEVGPSIFEGLDKPSLNPLRILLDIRDRELPVETYQGLAYWVPTSNFDGTGPVPADPQAGVRALALCGRFFQRNGAIGRLDAELRDVGWR